MGTGVKKWCLNPPCGKEILSSYSHLGLYLDSPKFRIVFVVTSVCQGIIRRYFYRIKTIIVKNY